MAGLPFGNRGDSVLVFQTISKAEIQGLADVTRRLRENSMFPSISALKSANSSTDEGYESDHIASASEVEERRAPQNQKPNADRLVSNFSQTADFLRKPTSSTDKHIESNHDIDINVEAGSANLEGPESSEASHRSNIEQKISLRFETTPSI